jgi:hypothetical protein
MYANTQKQEREHVSLAHKEHILIIREQIHSNTGARPRLACPPPPVASKGTKYIVYLLSIYRREQGQGQVAYLPLDRMGISHSRFCFEF